MNKHVEVPEGVQLLSPDFDYEEMEPDRQGDYFRVEDLPLIYKHFADRLLSDEVVEAACKQRWPLWICMKPEQKDAARKLARYDLQAALQATSIPTTSDEEG